METKVVELEVKDNVKSLRARLKEANLELQRVADQFGATSQEAVRASKVVAELRDEMGDLKTLSDSFNPDAKFTALSGSVSGVLNGFQAVEGGMALLGVESDKLQESMVRLQAVMNLSQGLQGLFEAKDTWKALGLVINDSYKSLIKYLTTTEAVTSAQATQEAVQSANVLTKEADVVATNAQAVATGVQATATEGATVATTALGTAMKALPILAIVGAVVALGSALYSYLDSSSKAEKLEEKRSKELAEQAKKYEVHTDAMYKDIVAFKSQIIAIKNSNAGSSERARLINQINATYGTTLKNLKDETAFQQQLTAALADYIAYSKAKLQIQVNEEKALEIMKQETKLTVTLNLAKSNLAETEKKLQGQDVLNISQLTEMRDKQRESVKKAEQAIIDNQKAVDALLGANGALQNQIQGKYIPTVVNSTSSVNSNTEAVKGLSDEEKAYQELVKQRGDLLKRIEDNSEAFNQSRLSEEEREKTAVRDKYFSLIEESKIYNSEIVDEEFKKIDALKIQYDKDIANTQLTNDEKTKITDKYYADSEAIGKATSDKLIDINSLNAQRTFELLKINQKYRDKENEDRIAKEEDIYQMSIDILENSLFKEIVQITNSYEKRFKLAEGNAELTKLVEEAMERDIAEAKKNWRKKEEDAVQESEDKKTDIRQKSTDKILEQTSLLFNQIGQIADEEARADEIRINKKYAQQLASAQGNAELTAQIEKKKQKEIEMEQRKAFKIKKASDIAGAIIDGARAVTSTLAQYPKFDGGIAMYASLATTLVATGLAIAKIKNTQFEGGGSGGSSSPSGSGGATGGGINAPSFNVVGATGGNQLAQLEQQPMKAYVVASEVSSAQELDRNRIMNATF